MARQISTVHGMLRIRILRGLTFDMRGGRQPAKPDVGRPLDGKVRPRATLPNSRPRPSVYALGGTHAPPRAQ
jgi:hypothetical protein